MCCNILKSRLLSSFNAMAVLLTLLKKIGNDVTLNFSTCLIFVHVLSFKIFLNNDFASFRAVTSYLFYNFLLFRTFHFVSSFLNLSVCPSVTGVLWQNLTMHCRYFHTTRKSYQSSFLKPTAVVGWCPFPFEICAQKWPTPSKNTDFDRFPLITCQP